MTVRIISDGTPTGTRVVAVDHDGVEHRLGLVSSIEWKIEVGKPSRAVVQFEKVELDVTAAVEA